MMPPDDITWIQAKTAAGKALLLQTDTYLRSDCEGLAAKLIYFERPTFADNNVKKQFRGTTWYSVVNCYERGSLTSRDDSEIQQSAAQLGFECARGFHANLSHVQLSQIESVSPSLAIYDVNGHHELQSVISEMSDFYCVDPSRFRVTGGTALTGQWSDCGHDLDIVVPLDSQRQCASISQSLRPKESQSVVEYGLLWPLRWRASHGTIVCPFFVYGDFGPPWTIVDATDAVFCGELEIADDQLGIMNTPVYETRGGVGLLLFRTRIVRGLVRTGCRLHVNAPVFEFRNCLGDTRMGIVVTNPNLEVLDFVTNVVEPAYA